MGLSVGDGITATDSVIGGEVVGSTPNCVLYVDAAGLLANDSGFSFNPTGGSTGDQLTVGGLKVTGAGDAPTPAVSIGASNNGFYYAGSGVTYYSSLGAVRAGFGAGVYLGTEWLRYGSSVGATDAVLSRYATKQLMISGDGTGATTNAGLVIGYPGTTDYGSIWASSIVAAKDSTNYNFTTNGNTTYVRGATTVGFVSGNDVKLGIASTAGAGPSITAGTATTDVNALSITQTWNNVAVAFKAIVLDVTETAAAAGKMFFDFRYGGTTNMRISQNLISAGSDGFSGLQIGGSTANSNGLLAVRSDSFAAVRDGGGFAWVTGGNNPYGGTLDTKITRYAAKQIMISGDGTGATTNAGWIAGYGGVSGFSILAPSAGAAPSSTVYSVGADSNNFTYINGAAVNILINGVTKVSHAATAGIGPAISAGTATTDVNALNITQTINAAAVNFTGIKATFTEGASGTGGSTKLLDLLYGTSGAETSKFNVSKAGDVTSAASIAASTFLQATTYFGINAKAVMRSPSDGILTISNWAETGFTRLQFGGTTSSFPALARNSTSLEVKLADDSAYATINASNVHVGAGTAIPTGGSSSGVLKISTTSGFGVYYGADAPTVSAAQGSLYLRSNGSSTTTRAYINTDGGTTWTAISTVA